MQCVLCGQSDRISPLLKDNQWYLECRKCDSLIPMAANDAQAMVPYIDPTIRHVGTSYLRKLNADTLKELEDMLVIQDGDDPVVVMIPYAMYIKIQSRLLPRGSQ